MRRALTLVELLIALCIALVLLGLLLPAVQKSREAANAEKCRNSLRMYALACHNYESTYGRLPAMGGEGRRDGGKWASDVAPFCEGMTSGRADRGLDCPSKFRRAPQQSYAAADYEQDGLFVRYELGIGTTTVLDGLSNTVMLAEKWYRDGNTLNGRTIFARTTSVPFGRDDCEPGSLGGFGSAHPGGLPTAFGDGSVRTISYRVDPNSWRAMGTRHGDDN